MLDARARAVAPHNFQFALVGGARVRRDAELLEIAADKLQAERMNRADLRAPKQKLLPAQAAVLRMRRDQFGHARHDALFHLKRRRV